MTSFRPEAYLKKSQAAAQEMEILFEAGHFSGASDRAYYTVFHMAQALLACEGHEFSSHEAVISAFGREFAKTGKIDRKYHRILREAFDLRMTADYDIEANIDRETAQNLIVECREFLQVIDKLVNH